MTPSSTASEEEDCRLAEEEQKKEEEKVAVRCGLCSITLSRIVVPIGEVAVSFLSNSWFIHHKRREQDSWYLFNH